MINRQPIYKPEYDVKPFNISDDPTGARARLQRQIEKNEEEDRENRDIPSAACSKHACKTISSISKKY